METESKKSLTLPNGSVVSTNWENEYCIARSQMSNLKVEELPKDITFTVVEKAGDDYGDYKFNARGGTSIAVVREKMEEWDFQLDMMYLLNRQQLEKLIVQTCVEELENTVEFNFGGAIELTYWIVLEGETLTEVIQKADKLFEEINRRCSKIEL